MAVVLDTGPLFAALDGADPDHAACARLIGDADEDLVVPALVLAELDYWCHERLGLDAWLIFLEDLMKGAYRSEAPTAADLRRCHELQSTYADLRIGVVDASIVALVDRLNEDRLATLDPRQFSVVRLASGRPLELLPN